MLSRTLLVVAVAFGSALAQDCPFYPGTCPINVDNVVEVNLGFLFSFLSESLFLISSPSLWPWGNV